MPPRLACGPLEQLSQRHAVPVLDFLLPWAAIRGPRPAIVRFGATAAAPAVPQPSFEVSTEDWAVPRRAEPSGLGGLITSSEAMVREDRPWKDRSHTSVLGENAQAGPSRLPAPNPPTYNPGTRRRRSLIHLLRPSLPNAPLPRLSSQQPPPANPAHPSLRCLLSRPNPPPPSILLSSLLLHPSRLTRESGELLASYARRMNDGKTERGVLDLMGRMRIGPVGWVRGRRKWEGRLADAARREEGNTRLEEEDGVECIWQPEDMPEMSSGGGRISRRHRRKARQALHREIPPHISSAADTHSATRRSHKPNIWAIRSWPPLERLPTPCTPDHFLRYLHHLLLALPSRAPTLTLSEALDLLYSLFPRHQHTSEQALAVLHLFFAYPSRPVHAESSLCDPSSITASLFNLLDDFIDRYPSIRPTRQTLHLVLLSRLARHSRPQSTIMTCLSSARSEPRAHIPSKAPVDPLAIIARFSTAWGITPGCETLRHLFRWSLRADRVDIAEYAWRAWNAEHSRSRRLRSEQELAVPRPISRANEADGGDRGMNRGEAGTAVGVRFRFRRLGLGWARWARAMRSAQMNGWVRRDDDAAGGRIWLGASVEKAEKAGEPMNERVEEVEGSEPGRPETGGEGASALA